VHSRQSIRRGIATTFDQYCKISTCSCVVAYLLNGYCHCVCELLCSSSVDNCVTARGSCIEPVIARFCLFRHSACRVCVAAVLTVLLSCSTDYLDYRCTGSWIIKTISQCCCILILLFSLSFTHGVFCTIDSYVLYISNYWEIFVESNWIIWKVRTVIDNR